MRTPSTKLLCAKITCSVAIICAVSAFTLQADDRTIRDANGKPIARIEQTATGEVVRDASSGKIIERREGRGERVIVRDTNHKIIRTEPAPSPKR